MKLNAHINKQTIKQIMIYFDDIVSFGHNCLEGEQSKMNILDKNGNLIHFRN